MKKLFKSLIGLGLLVLGLNAHALQTSLVLTNGATNVVLTAGAGISRIQVVTGTTLASGTNAIVKLYDSSTGSLVYTNAPYTTYITVTTNMSSVYTNSVGTVTTNTYPGVYTYPTAGSTNNTLPVIYNQAFLTGSSYTAFPNLVTYRGLSATVWTTNVTLIIDYYEPF